MLDLITSGQEHHPHRGNQDRILVVSRKRMEHQPVRHQFSFQRTFRPPKVQFLTLGQNIDVETVMSVDHRMNNVHKRIVNEMHLMVG